MTKLAKKPLSILLIRDLAIIREQTRLRCEQHFLTQKVLALRKAKAQGRNIILPAAPQSTDQFIAE